LDEKEKKKSKKTVIGHMQNRSVADYLLLPGGSLLLPIIKFIPNYYHQLLMKI
jgi:hypothetical protein